MFKKRFLLIIMVVIFALALTACKNDQSIDSATEPVDTDLETLLIKQSEVLVEDMTSGNFDTTVEKLSAETKKILTKEQLAQGFSITTQSGGAYKKIYATEATASESGITVASVIQYEKSAFKITIAYDKSNSITGVWISPAEISEAESNDKFTETAIKIGKDPFILDGMLTQPTSNPVKAVVILVQGSGQSGMNEAVGENKPFQDIAQGLAEQGVSSIRYNKRFFQYADKVTAEAVTLDNEVLEDVSYAINFVASNDSLKDYKIYIVGHSMGGMLAPKIALDNEEVDGFISLAGSPRLLIDIILDQNMALIDSMSDKSQEEKDALIASVEEQYKLAKAVKSDTAATTVLGLPSGYVYSLNSIDTPSILKQIDIPMLFLQGSADFQVYADTDYLEWERLLDGNSKAEFKLYDGLNHMFFKTKGKSDMSDYDGLNHVEQVVIDDMASWITKLAG